MIFHLYYEKSIISLIILSNLLFKICIYYILLIFVLQLHFFLQQCSLKVIAHQSEPRP